MPSMSPHVDVDHFERSLRDAASSAKVTLGYITVGKYGEMSTSYMSRYAPVSVDIHPVGMRSAHVVFTADISEFAERLEDLVMFHGVDSSAHNEIVTYLITSSWRECARLFYQPMEDEKQYQLVIAPGYGYEVSSAEIFRLMGRVSSLLRDLVRDIPKRLTARAFDEISITGGDAPEELKP